jgi:hypothetical protein
LNRSRSRPRPRPSTPCPDRGHGGSGGSSYDIAVPPGHSTLEVALAVLERVVKDHHGVVTEADIGPDGTGSFLVRVPSAPIGRRRH